MELVLSKFKHDSQTVHVKCKESNITINTFTFKYKFNIEMVDYKKQIFAVKTDYGPILYRINDASEIFKLHGIASYRMKFMPKYGVGFISYIDRICVFDSETSNLIDTLFTEDYIDNLQIYEELLFVLQITIKL